MEKTLKEKTAKGLFWGGISNILQQLVVLSFGIFIARILYPEDVGLVGLLTIFTLLATTIQEGGFSIALINKKHVNKEEYSSVFWTNVIISSILYLLLFLSAPLIAEYFSEPRLVLLSKVVFLTILFSGFGIVQNTILTKSLEIKKLTIINFISILISSSTGLLLALRGFSYWSIAIQALVLSFSKTMLLWKMSDWKPDFTINIKFIKSIFSFSIKMLLSALVGHISNGMYSVLLGKYGTINQVGFYTQGNRWATIPSGFLCSVIQTVSLPVMAEVKEDKAREYIVFRKMLRFTAFISFPISLGFGFLISEFIPLFVGEKWNGCIPIIRLFCVSGALNSIQAIYNHILTSNGYAKYILYTNIAYSFLLISSLFVSVKYGILPMILSMIIIQSIFFIIAISYTKRKLGFLFINFIKDTAPFLIITLSIFGIITLLLQGLENLWLIFILKIIISVTGYILIMTLFNVTIFNESLSFLKQKIFSTLNK